MKTKYNLTIVSSLTIILMTACGGGDKKSSSNEYKRPEGIEEAKTYPIDSNYSKHYLGRCTWVDGSKSGYLIETNDLASNPKIQVRYGADTNDTYTLSVNNNGKFAQSIFNIHSGVYPNRRLRGIVKQDEAYITGFITIFSGEKPSTSSVENLIRTCSLIASTNAVSIEALLSGSALSQGCPDHTRWSSYTNSCLFLTSKEETQKPKNYKLSILSFAAKSAENGSTVWWKIDNPNKEKLSCEIVYGVKDKKKLSITDCKEEGVKQLPFIEAGMLSVQLKVVTETKKTATKIIQYKISVPYGSQPIINEFKFDRPKISAGEKVPLRWNTNIDVSDPYQKCSIDYGNGKIRKEDFGGACDFGNAPISYLIEGNYTAHMHIENTQGQHDDAYATLIVTKGAENLPYYESDNEEKEQEVINEINRIRKQNNLPVLKQNKLLTQATRRHSRDMADHDFIHFTGSDKSSPEKRITDTTYNYGKHFVDSALFGANSNGDTAKMVAVWMKDVWKKRGILDTDFTAKDIGVGYAMNAEGSKHYWAVEIVLPYQK